MIYGASAVTARQRMGDEFFYLKRQLIAALVGTTAMLFGLRLGDFQLGRQSIDQSLQAVAGVFLQCGRGGVKGRFCRIFLVVKRFLLPMVIGLLVPLLGLILRCQHVLIGAVEHHVKDLGPLELVFKEGGFPGHAELCAIKVVQASHLRPCPVSAQEEFLTQPFRFGQGRVLPLLEALQPIHDLGDLFAGQFLLGNLARILELVPGSLDLLLSLLHGVLGLLATFE